MPPRVPHQVSAIVFSQPSSKLSHSPSATVFHVSSSLQFSATALSFFHNPLSTPHPLLPPPPYFRLPRLLTYPRVSPAYFLRTPRILRVTRLGPPEKVGNVNRVHGNRARPNLCSFTPLLSKPFLPHLSLSILLSPHTTTPCTHHLSAITRT